MAKNSYIAFNGLRGQPLKPREIHALRLYAADETIGAIAARLGLKADSIRKILSKVRCKLGARTILCAYAKAKRLHVV